jgi:hypothetical protein
MPFIFYLFSMPIGVRSFNSQMNIYSFFLILGTRRNLFFFHLFCTQWQFHSVVALVELLQTQHANNQNLSGHYSITNPTTFINKYDSRKHSVFILCNSHSIKNPHRFILLELFFDNFLGTSPFLSVPNPRDHGS